MIFRKIRRPFPFAWDAARCVPINCKFSFLLSFSSITRECVLETGNPNTEQVCELDENVAKFHGISFQRGDDE